MKDDEIETAKSKKKTAAYLPWLVMIFCFGCCILYYGSMYLNTQNLRAELKRHLETKSNLVQQEKETQESARELYKRWRTHEVALMNLNRAIYMTPFEDFKHSREPFFAVTQRGLPGNKGMEVILNFPPGDQTLKVAFPLANDLNKSPEKIAGHWNRDALHFKCSGEVVLKPGFCYQISYQFVEKENGTHAVTEIRSHQQLIYSQSVPYKPSSKNIGPPNGGTRNTIFLPGEIDPDTLILKQKNGPRKWSSELTEYLEDRTQIIHALRFTYEKEPQAFMSPIGMANYERTRRNYHWPPLSQTFEPLTSSEKFIFRELPTSTGYKSPPLY